MTNFIGTPPVLSEHGQKIDDLSWYIHGMMAVLFVGWLIYYAYALFRFRSSRNPKADYDGAQTHVSTYVEIGVAVVEGILLIGFAIPLWTQNVEAFPADKDATVIEVIGRQFNWTARYSGVDGKFGRKDPKLVSADNPLGLDKADPAAKDDIVVVNDLVAPLDKPVVCRITSLDVIHSFALRPQRLCQDAIPGMMIPVHFKPTQVATNLIMCAQLCGNSHYAMRGTFTVKTPADYEKWVKEKSKGGGDAGYE